MNGVYRARGVAAGLVLLLSAGAAEAGLTYGSTSRSVEAFVGEAARPREFDGDAGLAPFDADVSAEDRSPDGRLMRGRATQSSTLGEGVVRASGELSARSELDRARSTVRFQLGFNVTEPTPYTLTASFAGALTGPLTRPPQGVDPLFSVGIRQGNVNARPGPFLVGGGSTEAGFRAGTQPPEFSNAGTLAPGPYVLDLFLSAYADADANDDQIYDVADQRGSYTLEFRHGAGIDPGPGPGPEPGPGPAVPLPPAGWAGLLTLGGIAVARLRAGRRS